MFNVDNLRQLLNARPFVPFRLVLSDGGTIEIKSPELVWPSRQLAIIGFLDPEAKDVLIDRWTTVWYLHVTRAEQIAPGARPFTSTGGQAESPVPSPAR